MHPEPPGTGGARLSPRARAVTPRRLTSPADEMRRTNDGAFELPTTPNRKGTPTLPALPPPPPPPPHSPREAASRDSSFSRTRPYSPREGSRPYSPQVAGAALKSNFKQIAPGGGSPAMQHEVQQAVRTKGGGVGGVRVAGAGPGAAPMSVGTMDDFDRFLAGDENQEAVGLTTEELDAETQAPARDVPERCVPRYTSLNTARAAQALPAGQRHKLDLILQERAKLLNRFFEEQLKKQYDAMKREVRRRKIWTEVHHIPRGIGSDFIP